MNPDDNTIFEDGDDESDDYQMPYGDYIAAAHNALTSIDGMDTITKADIARVQRIRSKSLYLIDRSLTMLVREFDDTHHKQSTHDENE